MTKVAVATSVGTKPDDARGVSRKICSGVRYIAEYTADSYVQRVIRTIHDVQHMSSNAEECVSVSRTPIRADMAAVSISVDE